MNSQCGCGVRGNKYVTVVLWLLILFLTTLFTLLFIMCFIHFLKHTHTPIVPNDLQDYSTTKSIYFLLSFYFLLWTVVYVGCTIFAVVRKKSGYQSEKPGKALLIVLLILLGIITMLLCTIDRVYSPWILNFLNGKIFEYCVQVSALITFIAAVCYLVTFVTLMLCSNKKAISSSGQGSLAIRMLEESAPLKRSFANPCYNLEFSVNDANILDQNVTQV